MKAVVVTGDDPGSLAIAEVPRPVPGAGEVLLRVAASGVNFADTRRRAEPGAAQPVVPGSEPAGVVVELGPNAAAAAPDRAGLAVGTRVLATFAPGSYAEYVTAPAHVLHRVPEGKSLTEAAAFPINFLTAWFTVHHRAQVEAGQTVLVHAAGGGVGSAAVQLAKRAGCVVIAVASSEAKLALARSLGADHAIASGPGFANEVRALLGEPRPVDVVLDSVGGEVLVESLDLLRPWGRYVGYGQAGGTPATIDAYRAAIPFHLELRFVALRSLLLSADPGDRELLRQAMAHLLELWAAGAIRPGQVEVLEMDRAADAHDRLKARAVPGKLVLRTGTE